jgi:hypothetical protein
MYWRRVIWMLNHVQDVWMENGMVWMIPMDREMEMEMEMEMETQL